MKDRITISRDEFMDVCGITFHALVATGKLAESELDKYTDITAALTYIFTDEYAEYSERRRQVEQYIKENPERDGKTENGGSEAEA